MPVREQLVPGQVFTPYDRLLISVAFVVLCRVGCLGVTGVPLVFRRYINIRLFWVLLKLPIQHQKQ